MNMLSKLALSTLLLNLIVATPFATSAIAKDKDHDSSWGDKGRGGRDNDRGHVSGVPGPLAGAGLPILAVGYGAYWLVRRYRRKSDAA